MPPHFLPIMINEALQVFLCKLVITELDPVRNNFTSERTSIGQQVTPYIGPGVYVILNVLVFLIDWCTSAMILYWFYCPEMFSLSGFYSTPLPLSITCGPLQMSPFRQIFSVLNAVECNIFPSFWRSKTQLEILLNVLLSRAHQPYFLGVPEGCDSGSQCGVMGSLLRCVLLILLRKALEIVH